MASIAYPTALRVPGPWMLDPQNLRDLDNLIDACLRKMSEGRDAELEAALSERKAEFFQEGRPEEQAEGFMKQMRLTLAGRLPPAKRRVTIYLSDGKAAHGSHFGELMGLATERDETPKGFSIHAKAGSAEIDVNLSLGRWQDRDLQVEVSGANKTLGMELFGELQNWATDLQPSKWQQMWVKARLPVMMALLVWFFLGIIVFASLSVPVLRPGPTVLQARKLAEQGVTPANEAKALQLILEIESGYGTEPIAVGHRPVSRVFSGIYLVVLLSLVVLFFPPRGAVGLWRGRGAVRRQRIWSNAVSVSIPLLILGSVILPAIAHRLGLT